VVVVSNRPNDTDRYTVPILKRKKTVDVRKV
jgi:hypothetical protein